MKRTTNKEQKTYMLAKSYLETLESQEKEIEHQYIMDNKIVNADGAIPELIYCIDDEAMFDKANADCSRITESSGLWDEILKARKLLKIAEENLIKYALSLAPTREKSILTKEVSQNYTTRLKVLDLVLKLDVSTVPSLIN
jgi:oligoribonuclease (3'-5' exoribonuclease)